MNNYIIENKDVLKRTRNIRNESLNKTHRYILSDYPITLEKQIIIKTYRQDLREFINNNEIKILAGKKAEFPTQPDFINLNIIYKKYYYLYKYMIIWLKIKI